MISEQTRSALDALNIQIGEAEKMLRRLPGSRHDECVVEVAGGHLRFGPMIDGEYLVFNADGSEDEYLENLPISIRVQVAGEVPTLIQLAKQCESSFAQDALEAAAAIERQIATTHL
ncbi:MAG: hypothetical protein AAGG48_25280 [Planctomycetota bacterium]